MAIDHFEKRQLRPGQVDWNFNLIFAADPDVARMAEQYAPLLNHPGLYKPVPTEWLHSTILGIGTTEMFSEAEMLAVADKVQEHVAGIKLPKFRFDSWWLLFGNVVFHISPDDELTKLYNVVVASLAEVVGMERASKTPHGRFLAHTTFAYTKSHQNEHEIHDQLTKADIEPAHFRATQMPLIRQWPVDGHYEWEIVKQVGLS